MKRTVEKTQSVITKKSIETRDSNKFVLKPTLLAPVDSIAIDGDNEFTINSRLFGEAEFFGAAFLFQAISSEGLAVQDLTVRQILFGVEWYINGTYPGQLLDPDEVIQIRYNEKHLFIYCTARAVPDIEWISLTGDIQIVTNYGTLLIHVIAPL